MDTFLFIFTWRMMVFRIEKSKVLIELISEKAFLVVIVQKL